ncbi:MAG: MBL fold metallo-hydrolase [Acidobacteriaceae bacterium]|nr:MBL fold metallo-hydrolase [Acidobacteriaceae bacterium]MBV9307873.1 MBL fold metallo-hydrolase [Acidobacteriaceae bacterium]
MQISNRVYLIASGYAGCSLTHGNDCNAYAVRCGENYLLIDSGVGVNTESIMRELEHDGIVSGKIHSLLITHGHLDHSGGAYFLHRELGIPVIASCEAAAALEGGDEEAISLAAAKRAGIYQSDFRLNSCFIARKLKGGENWSVGDCRVTALRTPGHSRDMITYLVQAPDELLAFSGDTVFHGGKVLISDTWDCEPAAYANSLRSLAVYPIDGLYPGHAIWSIREGHRQVRQSLDYVNRLLLPPNLL